MVAKMEHHRWVAGAVVDGLEFWRQGARWGPENKQRIAIVDWAHLLDAEVVQDRDQIARGSSLARQRVECAKPN